MEPRYFYHYCSLVFFFFANFFFRLVAFCNLIWEPNADYRLIPDMRHITVNSHAHLDPMRSDVQWSSPRGYLNQSTKSILIVIALGCFVIITVLHLYVDEHRMSETRKGYAPRW